MVLHPSLGTTRTGDDCYCCQEVKENILAQRCGHQDDPKHLMVNVTFLILLYPGKAMVH